MSNRRPSTIKVAHIAAPIALAALIALASGCDGGDDAETQTDSPPVPPPPTKEPRSEAVRDCATRIEGPRLHRRPSDVVAGPIVFHGLRNAARDPSYYRERGRGRYDSFKTVTEVEANAEVTVVVPAGERSLALNYDIGHLPFAARRSQLQRTVEFRACAPSRSRFSGRGRVGPRTQFNAGFTSAGPGCRTFYVFSGQDAEPIQVRVGFGTRRRQCLADPETRAPQYDDQAAYPPAVNAFAGLAHHCHDFLDSRWIGRIAQSLVPRRASSVKPGCVAGERGRPAASSSF